MSWGGSYTYTTDEIVTAGNLNTYLRDNMKVGRNRGHTIRTAGNYTLNGINWADLDTALDIALAASAADQIEVSISSLWQNVVSAEGKLDVECVDSGNYFGSAVDPGTNEGIIAWAGFVFGMCPGAPFWRTLVADDISGGIATMRLRARTSSANNVTLTGSASRPFNFFANNHGPHVEP